MTRCGYVALLGRPNAGKSSLMNAMLDTHLSIVTERAQTTWERVTGVYTAGEVQAIFLDTPGLLVPRDLLQRSMRTAAEEAVIEADILLLVVDAGREKHPENAPIRDAIELSDAPLLAAINKVDLARPDRVEALSRWVRELGGEAYPTSALEARGVDDLLTAIATRLPEGPFLYPREDLATQPVRFFVTEFLREVVFEQFQDEIPYSTIARVEAFREAQNPVYIGVNLYVERDSQKGILIGKGGRAIRALGQEARTRIEHFLGRPVYLDLWVKTLPGWRRKREHLSRLGFRVPEETE